ncbi:vanadium-dependent haloperoxidase, partial [Streptomyces sp. NPDC059411]|uniref:vanadium-dependent haloperoxidase n=1 Tax=Streptomyces sp. NPDC059411 TaxID=3346825 RepID=UPI003697D6F2
VLLQAFRTATKADGAPGPLTRAGAMMHAAIWDAENSVAGGAAPAYGSYATTVSAPAGASAEAAIDYAAHDVLVKVFPGQAADFDTALTTELGRIPAGVTARQITDGQGVGQAVALAMVNARAADHSGDPVGYTETPDVPGRWLHTEEAVPPRTATTPGWGRVTPFTTTSLKPFQPALPGGYSSYAALLASPEYAAQVADVQSLGSAGSTARTPDQTQSALFWANDLGPDAKHPLGTYKPPGQLFSLTQIVSKQQGLSQYANARLFALVSLSMADAAIVAWDSKYETAIQLWRPVSAITLADKISSPGVTPDKTWKPLSPDRDGNSFTPSFPSYVSGHSTFAGAWAGVMRAYFGDNVPFTATTEDPHAVGVTRKFTSFTDAANEDAYSRLYLGVHYRWDASAGLSSGFAVADSVYRNQLKATAPISYAGRVASSAAAASGTSLTLPVTRAVRSGDTLLVSAMLTNTHSGTVTATDTRGNSYTLVGDKTDGSSDRTLVLAALGVNPLTTADSITLTFPTTGEHHAAVDEFTGVTAVDRTSVATGAAGTPFNSGATAPTNSADELVFGVAGVQGGAAATWSAGFSALPTLSVVEDQLATAYRTVSATGSYAATGTATHQWMAAVVTLR